MTTDDTPDDSMEQRVPGNRVKLWLLLRADRNLVAVAPLTLVFVGLVIFGALDPVPLRDAVRASDPVETVFQALMTALITGVTLVITINQLVLSQELGSVGDQRERMEKAMEFQEDVEDSLDVDVSPSDPAGFLRAIILGSREKAERLAEEAGGVDEELGESLQEFLEGLRGNAGEVAGRLEDAEFGSFDVVYAVLDYNYSSKIHTARRLRQEYSDAGAGSDVDGAFEEVIESLKLFAPAREHVKTLYFQWELINLSRAVIYSSVPALLVTASYVLYLDDPATVTGSTLGVDNLVWLVSGGVVVALLPFALLLSYVVRIATVAKRTLAIGPIVLRGTETE